MAKASSSGTAITSKTGFVRNPRRLAYNSFMDTSKRYQQAPDCLLEDMDGDLLLYNPTTATTLQLNGPSAIIWQLLNEQHSVAEIIAALQEAYPDQAAQIEGDVLQAVSEFVAQSVIEVVPPEAVTSG